VTYGEVIDRVLAQAPEVRCCKHAVIAAERASASPAAPAFRLIIKNNCPHCPRVVVNVDVDTAAHTVQVRGR